MNVIEGVKKLESLRGVVKALSQLAEDKEYPDGEYLPDDVIRELEIMEAVVTKKVNTLEGALKELTFDAKSLF